MSYIQPKTDYKDGEVLYGIDLNGSNATIKAGVDDNFDRIQGLENSKQDVLTAGEGIQIEDNVISNTNISAEWGNIQGDITNQEDLQSSLAEKVDKVEGKGLSTNDYDDTAKGIVDNVTSALSDKVDKVSGKGLSTEDYTTAEKTKLSGLSNYDDSEIWDAIKYTGKNLFDKDNANIINGFLADGGTLSANASWRTTYIQCMSNTTYTISKVKSAVFRVADFENTPATGASWLNRTKNETATSITYTTASNGNYLAITYFNNTGTLTADEILDTIQVELGSTATDYEPYVGGQPILKTDTKQNILVSGTNIKTINDQSILGRGNIVIQGGSGGTSDYTQLTNKPQINSVTLTGNKSLSDLGINIPTQLSELTDDSTHRLVTDTEKTKLSGIESGAEVNDIDTIKVNGTTQTITSKAVDITVPTKLSDLTNDNNTVTDASYVHTDNNYTTAEKTKLSGIEAGAQVNVDEIVLDSSSITNDTKLLIEESDFSFQDKSFDGNIIWTNQNPSLPMELQTINLNSSNYDIYEIFYQADNRIMSTKSIKGYGANLVYYDADEDRGSSRSITYVSDTSLTIGVGYYAGSMNNNYCVPLYIIGYKTGLFS